MHSSANISAIQEQDNITNGTGTGDYVPAIHTEIFFYLGIFFMACCALILLLACICRYCGYSCAFSSKTTPCAHKESYSYNYTRPITNELSNDTTHTTEIPPVTNIDTPLQQRFYETRSNENITLDNPAEYTMQYNQ